VDETPVTRWHIADPAHPERPPAEVAYPAAGTPNAAVSLLLARLDGTAVPVGTDWEAFPYLVTARWQDGHDPLVVVQSRDQRTMRILRVQADGQASVLHEDTDPVWLEIVPGVPAWTADGRIVWTRDEQDARRLVMLAPGQEPVPVTPPGLQVRGVLAVDGDTVLFQASGEPAEAGLWSFGPDGLSQAGRPAALLALPPVAALLALPPVAALLALPPVAAGRPRRPISPSRRSRNSRRSPFPARCCSGRGRARSRPRSCSRPGISPDRAGSRCCSTRTAARTRSGWSRPAAPTWSRSGSPSRGSRS